MSGNFNNSLGKNSKSTYLFNYSGPIIDAQDDIAVYIQETQITSLKAYVHSIYRFQTKYFRLRRHTQKKSAKNQPQANTQAVNMIGN